MGRVLIQYKGCSGQPIAIATNSNQGWFLEKILKSPKRSNAGEHL